MIVCGGGSARDLKPEILDYITQHRLTTIGINRTILNPDYHLWTNNQRLHDYAECISTSSTLMLGDGIEKGLIDHIKPIMDFVEVKYTKKHRRYGYVNNKILGTYRTAGTLAIMVAHLLGATWIDVVGMDGFTLHPKNDLDNKLKDQHCYGKGFTDDATWEQCIEKDKLVYQDLRGLDRAGICFKILTPTVFKEFYKKPEGWN
jgi:hypothetical protein